MSATFLLEIGTEELPADFARLALPQLQDRVCRDLAEQRLPHGAITVTSTPRRLVVVIADLLERQQDLNEERKGPPVAQAFVDGVPGPAAIGFARRCGVDPQSLDVRETPKGPCVFASVLVEGQATTTLLADLIPTWIHALQGRRFMRWGTGEQRFSRPVRWLVALLGEELIPVCLVGSDPPVSSDRLSRGHRLHCTSLSIPSADQYSTCLAAAGVEVDRERRAAVIREGIEAGARSCEGVANCPESLFEELVDLVEDPRVLQGQIAERYLALPPEVISTVMQSHQRYVPLEVPGVEGDPLRLNAKSVLRAQFLLVANGLEAASAQIRRGNERVLSARLADAEFFHDVDRRQLSDQRREALDKVTFAEGLGSLRDRCDRISWFVDQLIQRLKLADGTAAEVRRAAHLCKHDLVSQMVGEFPELQGVIGGKYLLEEGESRGVALAVVEHYLPRGAGDALPGSDSGAVLALAERLELLLSIFAKGERPSGSSDPYALRRAGNGLLQILWKQGWQLNLEELLVAASAHWAELFPSFCVDTDLLINDLALLLRQRIVSQSEEEAFAPDLVQAVAGPGVSTERLLADPCDLQHRLLVLTRLREQQRLAPVQAVVQRAARLAEKGDLALDQLDPAKVIAAELFESPSEAELLEQIEALAPLALAGDYDALSEGLAGATPALESFFDGASSVMVMVDDKDLRRNRLNLLGVLRNQAAVLAHFEAIQ
ncbi:MAG: glycine--tRNA ligase subunit beta [Prochlorococcus sp.]